MCGQVIRMFKVLLCVVRVDQNTLLLRVVRWIRMDQNVQSVVTYGQVNKNGSECTECCYVWSGRSEWNRMYRVLLRMVRWIRMEQNVQRVVTCDQVDQNGTECTECCYVWSGGSEWNRMYNALLRVIRWISSTASCSQSPARTPMAAPSPCRCMYRTSGPATLW